MIYQAIQEDDDDELYEKKEQTNVIQLEKIQNKLSRSYTVTRKSFARATQMSEPFYAVLPFPFPFPSPR